MSPFVEEYCIPYMEVPETERELFFRGVRERTNEGEQYLTCFRLGL